MKNLIFCDCETSGLFDNRDHILEIALVAVKLPTFEHVADICAVVVPPMWETVKRNMHEKVLAMHTDSGLIAAVDKAALAQQNTTSVVEQYMRGFMNQHAPQTESWKTPLAGANPDFDRKFLKARMVHLHDKFHYRNYDVRSLTQLQDWIFGKVHVESPHRALPDALKAVQDVREFLGIEQATGGKNREQWAKA